MIYTIWMIAPGAEYYLKHGESKYYPPVLTDPDLDMTTEGWVKIGKIDSSQFTFPPKEEIVAGILGKIREEQKAFREKVAEQERAYEVRIQNCLALAYSPTTPKESSDDILF